MNRLPEFLLIVSLLLAGGQAGALQLRSEEILQDETPVLQTLQSGGVTLDQAVEQVRRQYKGRIVSAETKVRGNRVVHEIKVLTQDGKVKTVRVDGKKRG